jgi:hypothetical protein
MEVVGVFSTNVIWLTQSLDIWSGKLEVGMTALSFRAAEYCKEAA